jgi:hypothetical protein
LIKPLKEMSYKISFQELIDAQKDGLSKPRPSTYVQVGKQGEKLRPNHKLYLKELEEMGPEKRLAKAFELSNMAKRLFYEGLKMRFPEKSDEEIKDIYLNRITKCYNRNY